jgi:probable HAF family extracellular repeat protein
LVTDLGTLGDPYTFSTASDVNSSGVVVGHAFYPVPDATTLEDAQHSRAYFHDGAMHDLGAPSGIESFATSINDSGLIVGHTYRSGVGARAFIFDGDFHDLGTLGGQSSYGGAINNVGQIVGTSETADGNQRAFIYDTAMHDLGTLGGSNSFAGSINDSGVVVGRSEISPGVDVGHAFLFDGTMHDLGTLGGTGSSADGINSSGHVVGVSNTLHDATFHAFFYDGVMHDLGDLGGGYSHALAINASDQITGGSGTSDGRYHAFFYSSKTGMVDLNALIDPLSGWELQTGWAINDTGQIAGFGFLDGQSRAFLLTPVPEPLGITLGLASVPAIFSVVHRRRCR